MQKCVWLILIKYVTEIDYDLDIAYDYDFAVHCTTCFSFFSKTYIFETYSAIYCEIIIESDNCRLIGNRELNWDI